MLHIGKDLLATSFTKVIRKFRSDHKDFNIAVITVTSKVTVGVYWNTTDGDTFNEKNKFPVQDTWKLVPGDKILAAVKNKSDVNVKKNAIYIYDPKGASQTARGAWGKIPGGYMKKLIESSDIRSSLLESQIAKGNDSALAKLKELEERQEEISRLMSVTCGKFLSAIGTSEFKMQYNGGIEVRGEAGRNKEWGTMDLSITSDYRYRYSRDSDHTIEDFRLQLNMSSGQLGYNNPLEEDVSSMMVATKDAQRINKLWMKSYAPVIMELYLEERQVEIEIWTQTKLSAK